jgi:pyruvate dehydrogenase E1 component beta subunit
MTEELTCREAIAQAIADEMDADADVILFGEDVGAAGGVFKSTVGLFDRFGPGRVRDTPISEQAIVGTAIGAAIMGLRPIAEIMFADFAGVAFDQLVNQLAKFRYLTGGQANLPVTVRMANGAGAGFAAQHSQATENWFLNIPGLKIAVPGTVEDCYGLLRAAVRDDDPVLVFEHKNLLGMKGNIGSGPKRLGEAALVRTGRDVTVVATQQMRHRAVEAAELLAGEGIELEVIDPRTLVPFDDETVAESLGRTARLLVVQEGPPAGGWGASLLARMTQSHFHFFDAPPRLVASVETPVPYAGCLEDAWLPGHEDIAKAARDLVAF